METIVLCPEELCLGPTRFPHQANQALPGFPHVTSEYTIWTSGDLGKGTRFLPWKGTARIDMLPVLDKLPEFDVRHRFGLYDEISDVLPGRRLRQCNWVRFLRYSLVCNEEINVIGAKGPTGEPVFELIRDVGPKTELVAFFVPDRPEESLLLPAIQYIRQILLKRMIEESPIDLSTNLVMSNVFRHHSQQLSSPTHSVEGRKSVSSDSTASTAESDFLLLPRSLRPPQHLSGVPPHPPSLHLPPLAPVQHPQSAEAAAAAALHLSAFGPLAAAAAAAAAAQHMEKPHPHLGLPPQPPLNPPQPEKVAAQSKGAARGPLGTAGKTASKAARDQGSNPVKSVDRGNDGRSSGLMEASATTIVGAPATPRRREKNMLPCSYCGKAFDRPSLLKRHIRIHTGERPHVCDVCSKGFSTSSSLNTHRRIHSGEKPHQCGVCGKRFTASSNLYYHKMTHIKEKPHKCTMCSKSFPTPGDLKSHTYVHTGTWPYKCHVCHRGFSKQTNLKNHLLLHSGDKPFSCDICQKKFALSCNLRAHLKTHESEYRSSPASYALYQRTLELLGVAEAQELAERGSNESSSSTSPSLRGKDDYEDEEDEDIDSAVMSPIPGRADEDDESEDDKNEDKTLDKDSSPLARMTRLKEDQDRLSPSPQPSPDHAATLRNIRGKGGKDTSMGQRSSSPILAKSRRTTLRIDDYATILRNQLTA